jgi:iron complex outermembrane receptor protein
MMRPSRVRLSYMLIALGGALSLPAQPTPPAPPAPPAPAKAAAASEDEVVQLEAFQVSDMKAFSDQAIPGKTPVAFTEIGKETISGELGSRDIPLVLNTAPSVYATTDGGAAGDARVNVRGFSQRNVSILINGVPTNDIENGWLYWSNWDGLGDVTSTIQMQRGLSNVTLPTPSIGGTMNIITDPAGTKRGGSAKFEVGSDEFYKITGVYNTGLLAGKFAVTVAGVAKMGDGNPRGAWSEALGYYVGATWKINSMHRLEVFAVGSPQEHGQRRFASNIAAYDAAYARKLGYTDAQIAAAIAVGPVNSGQDFNPNYAPVSTSYNGQQYYWDGLHSRHDSGYLNESVNYFHKPQVNLNWYATFTEDLKLTTVAYYSGGRGGGSGTLNNGSSSAAFGRFSNSHPLYGSNIDWDRTIASNRGAVAANGTTVKTPGRSLGILRNSVNNQDQYGVVSKLSYQVTPELKLTTGVDWRTAEIAHFREVRDLLGGDYYLPTAAQASEFWSTGTSTRLGLGDKVDYYNTNTVDWLGAFAQAQYELGPISAFLVYGYSWIEYGYTDHFRRASNGGEFTLNPSGTDGHQFKGGVNYAITTGLNAFVNAGWVDKVPVYDGVINDISGVLVDAGNETFVSYEAGLRYETPGRTFNVSANIYHTEWKDRTDTDVNNFSDVVTYLRGMDSEYEGLEVESAWQPLRWLRFDGAASFGKWRYTKDVTGEAFQISTGTTLATNARVYIKDLRVGDAPQSQVAYAATFYPVHGLSIKAQGRWYSRYWAEFDPADRTNPNDRGHAWKIPAYTVYDLHVTYDLPLNTRAFDVSVFAHIFNVLDETYVSDATDNSGFEAISSAPSHSAQRAEVFLGPPLAWNIGVKVSF